MGAHELAFGGQVHPELEQVGVLVAKGVLAVMMPRPAVIHSHRRVERAQVADVVAVFEHAVEHERDGLQTVVRVPVEP